MRASRLPRGAALIASLFLLLAVLQLLADRLSAISLLVPALLTAAAVLLFKRSEHGRLLASALLWVLACRFLSSTVAVAFGALGMSHADSYSGFGTGLLLLAAGAGCVQAARYLARSEVITAFIAEGSGASATQIRVSQRMRVGVIVTALLLVLVAIEWKRKQRLQSELLELKGTLQLLDDTPGMPSL